jgi:monomeric isocitrate dehydrogenase
MAESRGPVLPPYGPSIHKAIASNDLARMREIAKTAQAWLDEHGNIGAALEALKAAIAQHEAKGR